MSGFTTEIQNNSSEVHNIGSACAYPAFELVLAANMAMTANLKQKPADLSALDTLSMSCAFSVNQCQYIASIYIAMCRSTLVLQYKYTGSESATDNERNNHVHTPQLHM